VRTLGSNGGLLSPCAIVLAGVWLRPREPFTDTEAELISQRSEAVQRYLEQLAERVRQLGAELPE